MNYQIWIVLAIASLVSIIPLLPKIKILHWKDDRWLSRHGNILPWDKAEHFIRDSVIVFFFQIWTWPITAFFIALWFNVTWEVKDGIRPYDDFGHVQGFSFKDLIAGMLGSGLVTLICHVVK